MIWLTEQVDLALAHTNRKKYDHTVRYLKNWLARAVRDLQEAERRQAQPYRQRPVASASAGGDSVEARLKARIAAGLDPPWLAEELAKDLATGVK